MEWILPTMPTALAEYLQTQVKQRGWTQRYLEDITGISKTALLSIMSGETSVPKLESLDKLAKVFRVPRAYLEGLCGFPEDVHLTVDELWTLAQLSDSQRVALIEVARQMIAGDVDKQ